MEKKELKERFFDRFFYAEDGSCDWDRWRKQDPNVVLDFILEELDRAREEGYQKGKDYQASLDRTCYGTSFEKLEKGRIEDKSPLAPEKGIDWSSPMSPMRR